MKNSKGLRLVVAMVIGVAITAILAVGAKVAHEQGAKSLARVLFWQNTMLQSLVPVHNIATPDRPVYEGTPVNYAAYLASYPLGVLVYAVVAFAALSRR